jgi:hypothetical protein
MEEAILKLLRAHVEGEDMSDSHGWYESHTFVADAVSKASMTESDARAFLAKHADVPQGLSYYFCSRLVPGLYADPITDDHKNKMKALLQEAGCVSC